MVSFTCNHCQDVIKKPKVPNHANTCGSHSFTCVDCMHVFDLDSIKAHTSCVTEEDKYQGKWKQKLSNNNNSNGKSSSGEPPRGIERPPRAPMNDLSSSEESDDDWVKTSGGGAKKQKKVVAPVTTKSVTAPARRKNPRPGVSPSSDEDDDVVHASTAAHPKAAAAATTMIPAAKKAKTSSSASATPQAATKVATAAAATTRSPRSSSLGPKMSATPTHRDHHKAADADDGAETRHPGKKDTPLLLPRSTMSTDCVVPSFVLGTSEEVAEIVRDVLAESGVTAMRGKDVALALVDRYSKRIAKAVRHAVDAAVELRSLQVDTKGNISLA